MESTLSSFEHAIKEEGVKPYFIKLVLLAIAYIVAAKIGLALAFNFDQITTIWPAAGIAMTALLLWGFHYWPGIFVGAFMANFLANVSPPVATGIAVGNTLEAVIAILLIKRFIPNGDILERITNVVSFVALAPFLSSVIAASMGVVSLIAGGVIDESQVARAWFTWWVGDVMGALLIVPLVIAWRERRYREQLHGHIYEGIALLLLVTMASVLIFSQHANATDTTLPLVYLIFPMIVLAAVRFTQIGAMTAGTVIAISAIWGTLVNKGPYAQSNSIEENIFNLHFFLLIALGTALVLSVAVYGRLRSEQTLVKQAVELEQAKQQIMRDVALRKDLQDQVHDASSKINEILTGIFENDKRPKPPRSLDQ